MNNDAFRCGATAEVHRRARPPRLGVRSSRRLDLSLRLWHVHAHLGFSFGRLASVAAHTYSCARSFSRSNSPAMSGMAIRPAHGRPGSGCRSPRPRCNSPLELPHQRLQGLRLGRLEVRNWKMEKVGISGGAPQVGRVLALAVAFRAVLADERNERRHSRLGEGQRIRPCRCLRPAAAGPLADQNMARDEPVRGAGRGRG